MDKYHPGYFGKVSTRNKKHGNAKEDTWASVHLPTIEFFLSAIECLTFYYFSFSIPTGRYENFPLEETLVPLPNHQR